MAAKQMEETECSLVQMPKMNAAPIPKRYHGKIRRFNTTLVLREKNNEASIAAPAAQPNTTGEAVFTSG
jgi:hypothetical protein